MQITIFSAQDTLPVLVQVRAPRDFKKHELVLTPAAGNLVDAERAFGKNCKIHEAYVASVSVTFSAKRPKKEQHESKMRLYSPLFAATAPSLDKLLLDPFWGLLRCGRSPTAKPNMEIQQYSMEIGKIKSTLGPPELLSKVTATIRVPVATNPAPLKKGDLLLLPFNGGPGCG